MEHRPFPPNATKPPQSKLPWPLIAIIVAGLILAAIIYSIPNTNKAATSSLSSPAPGSSVLQLTELNAVPQSAAGVANVDVYGRATNTGPQTIHGAMVSGEFKNQKGVITFEQQQPMERVNSKKRDEDVVAKGLDQEPIKPGDTVDFRVRFNQVPADWDHQPPKLSVMRVMEAK